MFHSLYSHGFVRAAVGIPALRVAEPRYNVEQTLGLARRASDAKAALVLFPELGVSAYSNEDLFHQDALLDATLTALRDVLESSRELMPILVVGTPLRLDGQLFNCAVAIHRGRILGITPKTYLPNYREFYEKRQFTSGRDATRQEVNVLGQRVLFGNDLVYDVTNVPGLAIAVEICEDVWVPIPPSTYAAFAGATVLLNLSASNITIGKADYRRSLCTSQSGRCVAAYLYAAAGSGESTTDLAWDGQAMIFENHDLLAESHRFAPDEQLIVADERLRNRSIDRVVDRLVQERMRLTSFNDCAGVHLEGVRAVRHVPVEIGLPEERLPLIRTIERFPYVPSDPSVRDDRCFETYNIQVQGLARRLGATGIKKIVIGVSGGLDSTQALIVATKALERQGLPTSNVLAYTMPGFATSDATRNNALALMHALHVTSGANYQDALVVGTGDLSELALGWCTYGVGDQMSHYAVNASVPKTLIRHVIRWAIATKQFDPEATSILESIVKMRISPELVPGGGERATEPMQHTEETIGPFELQDFNLYYISRYGYRPSKVAFLASHAWNREYSLQTIKKWLGVFLHRFFELSQFKRSCLPNGPKVGSGGSLSPRSDWRAPSDAHADVWLRELAERVPDV